VASDFERLCTARDYASYRALGAIDAAICYCRQGDSAMAMRILTNARADYNRADLNLQNFKNQKREDASHGNFTLA
jgi:hypothetical protein